jgi:RimJ/RimL family protein N-acetyltransferase
LRLLLRPWRDEDVAAFAEMSVDAAFKEYLPARRSQGGSGARRPGNLAPASRP